ncbi:hypothetical protein, partial [Pseudomonas sp. PA-3-11C]|uniref:hypothetical protein n=1 Tax=Pseudomonas sp. PA-3-11C TaxID=2665472 RepID=UPI001F2EF34E
YARDFFLKKEDGMRDTSIRLVGSEMYKREKPLPFCPQANGMTDCKRLAPGKGTTRHPEGSMRNPP